MFACASQRCWSLNQCCCVPGLQLKQLIYRSVIGGIVQEIHIRHSSTVNSWQNIDIHRYSNHVMITAGIETASASLNSSTWLDLSASKLYIGGQPTNSASVPSAMASFEGCIRDVRLNDNILPMTVSSSDARVQWSQSGVTSLCNLTSCTPACSLPYICRTVSETSQCVCPENTVCTTAVTPPPMVREQFPFYLYIIIGAAVLLIVVILTTFIVRKCRQDDPLGDAAAKEALRASVSPTYNYRNGKVPVMNDEPRPWRQDNVLDYSEEGGGEIRDVPFDINLLLQEVARPPSSLSYSSSELVYPQTRTAMTSVNSTAMPTACPTPGPHNPSNPNIFLASYGNSGNTTRSGSQATSMTRLNVDFPDQRTGRESRPVSKATERVIAGDRYHGSGRSTAHSSQRPSIQGSRKASPYTSGQSTPHFYHSSPSLAGSIQTPRQQQQQQQQMGMVRGGQGRRRSPQGSSSKGSPNSATTSSTNAATGATRLGVNAAISVTTKAGTTTTAPAGTAASGCKSRRPPAAFTADNAAKQYVVSCCFAP